MLFNSLHHGNMYMQVITAFGVLRVIRSKDSKYSEGDLLLNLSATVAEYSIVPSSHIIGKEKCFLDTNLKHRPNKYTVGILFSLFK
ncbi:unnamed protein product [Trifolium pratense]|uniref:Uncharacterized protein n=1 Tax=Trifolium pratense TaxID=57577 RepID=A0ACB0KTI9_TRIPR|nr:unnamed protein product [Trifolium pratense]